MNCPGCGAPMRLGSDDDFLTCDFCGSIHVAEPNSDGIRVLETRSNAECPLCNTPLVHAAVDRQRILFCTHCGGILARMAIFAALVEDLRSRRDVSSQSVAPINEVDLDRHIRCPRCQQAMDAHVYGGGGNVVIDACERCEVNWLDHGELERIVRAPDHQYVAGGE